MASSQPFRSSPSNTSSPLQTAHGRPRSSCSSLGLPGSPSPRSATVSPFGNPEERHPKGKRKRTTANDKAILESAYARNPKPEKAARLDIVNRVSLNEKEVQIWFQNRRQNDRRKSRPLSSQELAALRYGSMQILSSDPVSFNSSFSSDVTHTSPLQSMPRIERADASPLPTGPANSSFCEEATRVTELPSEPWLRRESNATEIRDSTNLTQKDDHVTEDPQRRRQSYSSLIDFSMSDWSIPKPLSTPAMRRGRGEDPFNHPPFTLPNISSPLQARAVQQRPDASKYRLSLCLDGKAEVVPTIPSPRRAVMLPPPSEDTYPSTIRRLNLLQSHSASSPVTLPPISFLTNSLPSQGSRREPPRLSRGRSRDVQAWESCCDAENREDPLTEQAKHESTGSAIAAISLIRSSSASGSPLQPSISAKRNATMAKATDRPSVAKKPRLANVLGSAVKLQSHLSHGEKRPSNKETSNLEKHKFLSGHDSDKENWSPDRAEIPHFSFSPRPDNSSLSRRLPLPATDAPNHEKNPRRTPARAPEGDIRPLLGQAHTAPPAMWARRGGRADHSPLKVFEDHNTSPARARPDDEVERFMRGDVSPSKKGDAEAVVGLLQLSQHAWQRQ